MSTHYYTGLTAFVKNTPETNAGFRALSRAVSQLKSYVGDFTDTDITAHQSIMNSLEFAFIRDNQVMFESKPAMFPENTPEKYQSVELESLEIKGVFITRLHIPMTDESQEELYTMSNQALAPVLGAIFRDDLLCIKVKESNDMFDFNDAKEHVVVSTQEEFV